MNYVTLSDADEYHAARNSFHQWNALSEDDKARRLISAADFLDVNYRFRGEKADPSQLRQFPRNDESEIPQAVKCAVCELALQENLTENPEQEMASVSVGAVQVAYRSGGMPKIGANRFAYVKALLAPLLANPHGAQLLRG